MSTDIPLPSSLPFPTDWTDPGAPSPWVLGSSCVLVVDDDEAVREVVCETLDEAGYAALEAEDGVEALTLLRIHRAVGLVFLDLMLPRMTGWELMRELAADVDLRRIPVVFMTALQPPAHASEWLGKPFETRGVLRFAERYLGPNR